MAVEIAPRTYDSLYRFSVEQYEKMIEAGILREDDHVELIDGEIVKMASRGLRHEACVRRLQLLFHELLGRAAVISTQNTVRVPPNSQPEPDLALLKWRGDMYEAERPMPEDTLLVIEVADSSLREDRGRKRAGYARAGIPEYWIVNLQDDIIEVYSNPMGASYNTTSLAKPGDILVLPGSLTGSIAVDDVLRTDLKSY
ncbi:MAG: Uma2 family endonuclease [Chloroflexia bacterium]